MASMERATHRRGHQDRQYELRGEAWGDVEEIAGAGAIAQAGMTFLSAFRLPGKSERRNVRATQPSGRQVVVLSGVAMPGSKAKIGNRSAAQNRDGAVGILRASAPPSVVPGEQGWALGRRRLPPYAVQPGAYASLMEEASNRRHQRGADHRPTSRKSTAEGIQIHEAARCSMRDLRFADGENEQPEKRATADPSRGRTIFEQRPTPRESRAEEIPIREAARCSTRGLRSWMEQRATVDQPKGGEHV